MFKLDKLHFQINYRMSGMVGINLTLWLVVPNIMNIAAKFLSLYIEPSLEFDRHMIKWSWVILNEDPLLGIPCDDDGWAATLSIPLSIRGMDGI